LPGIEGGPGGGRTGRGERELGWYGKVAWAGKTTGVQGWQGGGGSRGSEPATEAATTATVCIGNHNGCGTRKKMTGFLLNLNYFKLNVI
jgi:hypothetical protein